MVQKKLSLQLHHAASQGRGFPFPHHHDAAKSPRGADLKAKKMKKSVKRPATPPLCKTTPNYMKSTTCSDARKEQSQSSRSISSSPKRETVSFKAARKFNSVSKFDAKRATCSSTLKDSKFPALLPLNPSGHSAVKVCPYTYCSLNGHHHPPLTTFLSAARRTRVRAPPDDDDFFVEIYMPPRDQEEEEPFSEEFSGDSFGGSDMEWDTGYGSLLHYAYALQNKDEVLPDAQESVDEDGGFVFSSSSSDDDDETEFQSTHHLQISPPTQQVLFQQEEEIKDEENCKADDLNLPHEEAVAVAVEASDEAEEVGEIAEEINGLLQFAAVEATDEAEGRGEIAEEISGMLEFAAKSKKVVEDGDELGDFNPRAPNFLEVEAEPEAERVDLRHQDVDERKNSDEWMVDYALRQVVTKLSPAKKRKVALLVEAFEKVMPLPLPLPLPLPPTKFDLHLSHVSRFDQPRPMQACS